MNDLLILNAIIFFLEIIIIHVLQRKVGWFHPLLYGVVLPFFYSMAPFLDYIISGRTLFHIYNMNSFVDAGSTNYLFVNILYFSYILSYFLVVNYKFKIPPATKNKSEAYIRMYGGFSTMALFIGGAILIYYSFRGFYLDRGAMKSSATILSTILMQTSFLYVNFYLVTVAKKNLITAFLIVTIILYSLLSFERENIIIAFFALALIIWEEGKDASKIALAISATLLIAIISNFKAVMIAFKLYILGESTSEIMLSQNSFSLTMLDPVVTIILITEFFNENPYDMYLGSYVTNTLMQFIRMFGATEWQSLGEFATEHYTGNSMGTGFSMIVESMINFGYAGPLIVGGITAYIFCRIYYKFYDFKNIFHMILFIYSLKIVRTEFAVVIKLYILPALIAYFLLQFFYRKKHIKITND